MKKLFGITLIGIATLSLASCGDDSGSENTEPIRNLTCTYSNEVSGNYIQAIYYEFDENGNVTGGYYILGNGEHDDFDQDDLDDIAANTQINGDESDLANIQKNDKVDGGISCE